MHLEARRSFAWVRFERAGRGVSAVLATPQGGAVPPRSLSLLEAKKAICPAIIHMVTTWIDGRAPTVEELNGLTTLARAIDSPG